MASGSPDELFSLVAKEMRGMEPKLRKAWMAGVRKAATPMRDAMRTAVKGTSASASSSNSARAAWSLSKYRGKKWGRAEMSASRRSGLRDSVARSVRISARDRGVKIKVESGGLPPDQRKLPTYMNRGSWRHPVYGNNNAWVSQKVTPTGWFTKTAQRESPKARAQIESQVWKAVSQLADTLD